MAILELVAALTLASAALAVVPSPHGRARVVVVGRPRDVRGVDRWADLPGGPVRALWSTPVDGWTVVDGRPRMTRASAVWHLPDGEFTYGELELLAVDLDVPPGGNHR